MEEEKSLISRIPGLKWLDSKLSRKMVGALLVLALLGWLFSFTYLIHDIQSYTGRVYDEAMEEAQNLTQQVVSFLEGSQGDYSGLNSFLEEHGMGCCLKNSSGKVLYHHLMPGEEAYTRLATTSSATVLIPGRDPLTVSVWAPTMDRQDLVRGMAHKTFISLTIFNLALFVAAGILLYALIVSPISQLRRTMRDYTEKGTMPGRSSRHDEVGRLQNSFADLIGLLRSKEQSEHRLIASISHDIKTPLTSVLGYSERLLHASLTPEKQQRYTQGIHDKGLAIKSIVDEFDDYLDAGLRDDQPMVPMKAGQLCDRLKAEYADELADAGVQFSVDCRCPDVEFLCNMPHMSRCFGNLIGNSIKHAKAPHLELHILCRREDDALCLEFTDNGVGVPPALLQQIFEPLYTTDRGRKVSGLGLSICRSILQSHGGTIEASNRSGGGLLVKMLLPISTRKR